MKKLLLFLAVLSCTNVLLIAQDNWVDVNFTRDSTMWKESFTPLVVNGLNLQFTPVADNLYQGFKCEGAYGRFAVSNYSYTPFNVEDLQKQLIYAFRFTNNVPNTNWTFPEVPNVGKVKVNFLCGNATGEGSFTLQKYISGVGVDEVWADFDPVVTFTAPPHAFSTTSFVVEKEMNLSGPIRLRLKGPVLKNIHMYAVSISKNTNSAVDEERLGSIKIHMEGRSLSINIQDQVFNTTIYSLSGVKVGNISSNQTFNLSVAGTYLLRIQTDEYVVVKKIEAL